MEITDFINSKIYLPLRRIFAGMAELADAPDLGSGALRRGGSSPFARTEKIADLPLREELAFVFKIFYGNLIFDYHERYKG